MRGVTCKDFLQVQIEVSRQIERKQLFYKNICSGELVHACSGISRPMIRIVLEMLRKEGKLEVLGTGRGAKWRKRDNIR
jgi:hypothetical protein